MRPFALAALFALAMIVVFASPPSAFAQSIVTEREGWRVIPTGKTYDVLLANLREAVRENEMGLVTEAGPTEMAASRGETIPGNRVVGVFRNDFAVTIIRAAPSAMIEPPLRFMVMEEPDGTASLSYRLPSAVFAPYAEEGGEALTDAATQLDEVFAAIADDATAE